MFLIQRHKSYLMLFRKSRDQGIREADAMALPVLPLMQTTYHGRAQLQRNYSRVTDQLIEICALLPVTHPSI